MRLIEISKDARFIETIELSDVARSVCEATVAMYGKTGFIRPWVGYLAEENGRLVGACGFKTPPREGRVEIAYFTFPEDEGKGVATRMAALLIEKARDAEPSISIIAQTLPQENASTSVLRKLNFARVGMAHDEEVGEVWEWQLIPHSVA